MGSMVVQLLQRWCYLLVAVFIREMVGRKEGRRFLVKNRIIDVLFVVLTALVVGSLFDVVLVVLTALKQAH